MQKNKETPAEKEKQFNPDARDAPEYKRFLKTINRSNAARINRDIVYLKDYNMYEVQLAGPQFQAVMDTYTFKYKDTAEQCVKHAASFDKS